MQKLGKRVKQARQWRKMTQKQLAEKVKTHQNTISDLERGKFYPGLELGLRLSESLDVNIRWIVGHTDNHRRGIQLETEQEEENYLAYRAMSPKERQQFAEFMADFLRSRTGARAKA